MKENDVYSELSSIRSLMERSTKFISLSGLAGIAAGLYALAGALLAYLLTRNLASDDTGQSQPGGVLIVWQLFMIASTVLLFSIATACWLTMRKAKSKNENAWNPVSKRLLSAVVIPLITGGLFIFIMLGRAEYSMVAPACLIFYGLALVAGSIYTYSDVKWLGICEILIGLLALIIPGHDLVMWAVGFGLLNILYGTIMHFKYER